MCASPASESACPDCGSELTQTAPFCSDCGARLAAGPAPAPPDPPWHEPEPGPVTRVRAAPRWFGTTASLVLLSSGFAALGAGAGLFAAGRWPAGAVLLGVAVLLLTGYGGLAAREDRPELRRSAFLLSRSRARLSGVGEVVSARIGAELARRRARMRLDVLESELRAALEALGAAVWDGDAEGEERVRVRLAELDERRSVVDRELEARLGEADERIRRGRLEVDRTMLVAPVEPHATRPAPDKSLPTGRDPGDLADR
jgi:PAS domain-containing protein